jgi:hypothetical protein
MKAEAKGFKFLSLEGKVTIPFFQRTYVWDKDNWEDLLSELFNTTKTHFLGSIILKQLPSSSGEPKQLEVVDGQQRLTTLSVLLKALYDTFPPESKENCRGVVLELLFYRKDFVGANYEIKIDHSQVDANAYQSVIQANIDNKLALEHVNGNSQKILRCYQYFVNELQNKSEEQRKTLFNRILDPENKMLVVIDLVEGSDDEQAIFDTLNTAGVRLSPAETIKNALFQKVIKVFGSKESAIKLYKRTWEKTFLAEDTVKYWETERLTGRLMRDNIEILLHCIAVIKGFYDPDRHTLSDLSKLYKEEIARKSSKEVEAFLNEIIEYSDIYKETILTFDNSTLFSFDDAIKRLLHILEVLQISTFHPFILFVFKGYQNDDSRIVHMLSILEKFVVRRMISNQESKSYNKLCKDFINNPDLIGNKLGETTDDQISNGLRLISNKNAALLLFWVELNRRNKDRKYDTKELKYHYSLEHIMPQKWEEYWKDIPKKYNPDGSEMSEDQAKKDRYNKVYWIGNMTLLTSSLNSALRNYIFAKKMNGEGRKKGIKAYADLSITKDDVVTPFDNGDTVWDEEKIMERTAKIEKEIKDIWEHK